MLIFFRGLGQQTQQLYNEAVQSLSMDLCFTLSDRRTPDVTNFHLWI